MFSKILFAVVFIHFLSLGDCRCPRRNPCEPSPCDPNATCNRMMRSFQCVCNEGYSGDGSICDAIIVEDECEIGNNDCGCLEKCTERPEGNICECEDGYSSDGTSPCQPTSPLLFYNLCDAGEVCYVNDTCCIGVAEPGNPCTSNDECSSTFCHFGRCRCNADGSSAFHLDTSGQCVTSCQAHGPTFSYYPHRTVSGGWSFIAIYYNVETCFSECLNDDTCNLILFQTYPTNVCVPAQCYLVNVNTNAQTVFAGTHNYMYVRNCA